MSSTTGSDLEKTLAELAGVLLPVLREAVYGLRDPVKTVVSVHFGWPLSDAPADAVPGSIGKTLRGALTLLCCRAAGGQGQAGVSAAVAVELVHNASLIHDDIIDQDRTRRGRAALWVDRGLPVALLAGDALFFLAIDTLGQSVLPERGVKLLVSAVQELIVGELQDTLLEHRESVACTEVQTMSRSKTASLVAAACELGALAAGADPSRAKRLRAFGASVGEAFQATDDLLGIWGDPTRTGKPGGGDLRRRKKTLPVTYALASNTPAGRELSALYSGSAPLTNDDVERAAALVETTGGRRWAQRYADTCAEQAMVHLAAAEPEATAGRLLAQLATWSSRRDH